jgi:signal transduction histidine kinase
MIGRPSPGLASLPKDREAKSIMAVVLADSGNECFMTERRRIYLASLGITAVVSLAAASVAVYHLYHVTVQNYRVRLVEVVQSRARVIEAVTRFDAKYSQDHFPGGATAATLSQIIEAHEQFPGFGRTGEFTLAKSHGDQIAWLLKHRHGNSETPDPTPSDSEFAEPMRRALNGESGSVIGLDYRGVTVLAAHEEIRGTDWGVVAKIDLAEIHEPFLRAGLIVSGISFLTIAIGVGFIIRVTSSLLQRIEMRNLDLQEAHARLRLHSSETAVAVERDRRKLAVDLHDGLGQLLALAHIKLEMLRNAGKAERADSELHEIESLIREAHQHSGDISYQLCPPVLYDMGFVPACRWLAGDLKRRFDLRVTVEDDGQPGEFDEETRISLFRSVNELLTNVIKHAEVNEALVRIRQADGSITIVVEDQGGGFDPESTSGTFGLSTIRERLHHLGGTVKVNSIPGRGTRVVMVAPVSGAAEERQKKSA